MDRLLTNDEICQACPAIAMRTTEHKQLRCSVKTCLVHPDLIPVAAAQLAKTDNEWVEAMPIMWDKCWTKTCIYMTPDCDFLGNACMVWQERKRSIGL